MAFVCVNTYFNQWRSTLLYTNKNKTKAFLGQVVSGVGREQFSIEQKENN